MKKLTACTLAFLMLLSLCACGSSANKAQSGYSYSNSAPAAPAMADTAFEEAYYEQGLSASTAAGEADNGSGEAPEVDPDKIIYSSNVTVETTEFDASLEKLTALIEKYGAWVESSSVNKANYYDQSRGRISNRSADYTIRVPSDKFSAMMSGFSEIGNVPYTHTYTENVTSQYYDVQARLTAYTTQEATLLEMMEKAETVTDVITIEDRLTELRYEIESLQSTLNNWDRQVSYSSVYLSVREVQEYTPETETKISYGRELWLALTGALKNTGRFFKDLLVLLVSLLPALVIIAALFFLLRKPLKKLRDKRREKKEERAQRKTDAK